MAVVRSQFTEGLKADMYAYGFEAYDSLPPVHEQIFEVVGSSKAYEQSTTVIRGNELVEKPELEKITYRNPLEGWTVYGKNRTFADGVEFAMEIVEDMPPEKIANLVLDTARGWGAATIRKKEEFAAAFFNEGFKTAGHDTFSAFITGVTPSDAPTALCYDGKPFFNLSNNLRALYPGGTAAYYNGYTGQTFNETTLQTMWLLMTSTNNVDGQGKKIGLMPNTLLIPSAMHFSAKALLETDRVLGSGNNDINTVRGLLNPIEWQYLTDTDAFFVGAVKRGIKFHNRKPLTFDFYQDEDTKTYKANVVVRWGAHVYDWRFWTGANGATS
jgi:hypothetical protein